jgi:uncharacterized protein (TIGR00290 family)
MDLKKKVTISWSGGKDSAFALFKILASGEYEVVNLHTVIGQETKRVGLHGVREALIEQQAESMGIPLVKLYLPESNDHEAYTSLMRSYYNRCAREDIHGVVFGDIFLEDLKKFRENMLQDAGLQPYFPLWKIDTRLLLQDFINSNFKTLICSANAALFAEEVLGKTIDQKFLEALPPTVDPCGEHGEFHTFVYEGPIFKKAMKIGLGDTVKKEYHYQKKNDDGSLEQLTSAFWFQDLMLLS